MSRAAARRAPETAPIGAGGTAATLRDLGMRFGPSGPPALDGVSADLSAGRITGLVGPDAAGKTTLIRILAGLMQPTAGTALVFGRPPMDAAREAPNSIGYMPQRFGLYEDLSVMANLRLHARLRGLEGAERDRLFARLLDFTSLQPFTERLAGRLSGGMKQKLGIACALLGSPHLLLLDEPGVGVDPQSRRELWRMVQELSGGGMSIVWSTAYLEEAARCPHVIMLDQGKTIYVGPPGELTRRAEGRVFLIRPAGGDNRRELDWWTRRPGVDDALIQGSHVRVVLRADAPPALREEVLRRGGSPVSPRLEDAYISAVGGINQRPSPFGGFEEAKEECSGEGPFCKRVSSPEPPPPKTFSGGDGSSTASGVEAASRAPRIAARGLTKRFGSFTAADDITFDVLPGQIFGLLGPNGAGKSTTFRMLCGLSRPTAGSCFVDGVDLLTAGSAARSRLGYMAQKFSLYPDIPVQSNIYIFADLYGLSRRQRQERVPLLADALELGPFLKSKTADLPLGQKQRLALLCATLHNPPALFLDEPTSGVDARTRRDFWKHITAMTGSGTAVLVTTHFMEEAEYCDRIALVYRGAIISTGTPDELKARCPDPSLKDPTLEDAFIAYIEYHDKEHPR